MKGSGKARAAAASKGGGGERSIKRSGKRESLQLIHGTLGRKQVHIHRTLAEEKKQVANESQGGGQGGSVVASDRNREGGESTEKIKEEKEGKKGGNNKDNNNNIEKGQQQEEKKEEKEEEKETEDQKAVATTVGANEQQHRKKLERHTSALRKSCLGHLPNLASSNLENNSENNLERKLSLLGNLDAETYLEISDKPAIGHLFDALDASQDDKVSVVEFMIGIRVVMKRLGPNYEHHAPMTIFR